MKTFLAIYTGVMDSPEHQEWAKLSEAEQEKREQSGMAGWVNWVQKNSSAIVEVGSPIGATKRVGRDGITDISNHITAYTVVKASSHEAAAKLFIGHPHFTVFPGEAIEIMECLPLPMMKD